MEKINLKGKYIPLKYFSSYSVSVNPSRTQSLDEDGEERMPKAFSFRVVMDKLNNVYIIPLKQETVNGKVVDVPAYSLADIVEAASGDKEKQAKIDSYNEQMREEYHNEKMLSPAWNDVLLDQSRELFTNELNEFKASRGQKKNAASEIPEDTTSYEDLNEDEIQTLAGSAKTPKNKSQGPASPAPQDGRAQ